MASISLEVVPAPRLDLVGQRLDEVAAGERVDGVGDARLVADDLLGPQRDLRGLRRSAAREPRRSRWCGGSGCRRAPRRAPGVVTRTMLFSGCWAVSVEPPVWVWNRSTFERSSFAPKRSVMIRAHMRRAARNLATSSKRLLCAFQKKLSLGANSSTVEARRERGLDVGDAVGERERDLLDRGRARLADVVARDRDRVPLRHVLRAVREGVGDEPHRGPRRVDVGARAPRTPSGCRSGSSRRGRRAATPVLLGDELSREAGGSRRSR